MIHCDAFVHPKAHVDTQSCTVGAGTKIWQFASVTRGTVLGDDCVVWPHVTLDGAIFGDRCKIASGVAMGPGFKIGNDVFIGPNVVLCNDRWPRATKEGFLEHTLRPGNWKDSGQFAVIIEDGVSIGAGAIILPGVRIGAYAMIGASAVVLNDVPPATLISYDGDRVFDPLEDTSRLAKRMRYAK
jgi:UDP-2-acetamido-3-amino-2,3-dideoxy-glucuronate N-acetyltransferase